MNNRHLVFLVGAALGLALAAPAIAYAQTAPAKAAAPADARAKAIADVVAANHILADQGVVDGYGHVSVRDPTDPNKFLMARSMAPELVTAADVLVHDLDGNTPAPATVKLYLERFIHAESIVRVPT